MILDKKLSGILDQGTGALILFEAKPIDLVYQNSLSIIQSIGKVVDSLYIKVKKLSWKIITLLYQSTILRI